ncbi:unnamed protein product [Haemonchus placei]|uniref:Protein kinase domain-containing protein n=1 Tax=Haemonchus placei TaxID=6290 RepID=A0A0N4W2E6_HAEPC|nr:unnamed protein product [Haemonchus placei]
MSDEEDNPAAKFPRGKRFGEWVIIKKFDEGGFGQVYKVESTKQKGKVAALKAEPNSIEGGSTIKLEVPNYFYELYPSNLQWKTSKRELLGKDIL